MVKIYTIDNCFYCNELKNILTKNSIEFLNINIDLPENSDEFDKINAVAKSDSVPIVLVNKQILVPEVSFKSIDEAYKLVLKFLK